MHPSRPRLALSLVALALAAPPAHAQPTPTPVTATLATWLADWGMRAHGDGNYAGAIAAFAVADALAPHPVLQFDRAQSLRLAGRTDEAIAAYRAALTGELEPALAALARAHLAELSPAPRAVPQRITLAPPAPARATGPHDDTTARRGGRGRRVAAATATGLGVAALATAGYLGIVARDASDTLSRPGATWDPALDARGRRADRWMKLSATLGGVLVLGGVTAFVWDRGATRLVVNPGVDGGALSLTGAWR